MIESLDNLKRRAEYVVSTKDMLMTVDGRDILEMIKNLEDCETTIRVYAAIVEDMPIDDLFEIYEEELKND